MKYFQYLFAFLLLAAATTANAQYYEYDPDDPDHQGAALREGEKAFIPMDTGDPAFNLWQTPRDDLSEGREAAMSSVPSGVVSTGNHM